MSKAGCNHSIQFDLKFASSCRKKAVMEFPSLGVNWGCLIKSFKNFSPDILGWLALALAWKAWISPLRCCFDVHDQLLTRRKVFCEVFCEAFCEAFCDVSCDASCNTDNIGSTLRSMVDYYTDWWLRLQHYIPVKILATWTVSLTRGLVWSSTEFGLSHLGTLGCYESRW